MWPSAHHFISYWCLYWHQDEDVPEATEEKCGKCLMSLMQIF